MKTKSSLLVLLVLLVLLCGTVLPQNAAAITPAQEIAVRRYYDESIERAKKTILKIQTDLESNTDPARREMFVRMLSVAEQELAALEDQREKPEQYGAMWGPLQRLKKFNRLQWQEPKEGEKEGKWVPIPEKLG